MIYNLGLNALVEPAPQIPEDMARDLVSSVRKLSVVVGNTQELMPACKAGKPEAINGTVALVPKMLELSENVIVKLGNTKNIRKHSISRRESNRDLQPNCLIRKCHRC